MRLLLDGLCWLLAALLLAFGLYALFSIEQIMPITGLTITGPTGHSEGRAIYGGAFIAQAILIALALRRPALRAGILIALGGSYAGFVGARLVSIGLDGFDPALSASIISEVVAAAILLAAGLATGPAVGRARVAMA